MLYTGQNDHCAWYIRGAEFRRRRFRKWRLCRQRLGGGGKAEAPRGWITAIDGRTGAVRWKYHAETQVKAGMVPTKSGLLFAGDTHGHLLIFNAANGALIKSIDAGGALNSGLISYSVGGVQYVAATVGGTTRNPSAVAGPLRVAIYSIFANGEPNVVTLPRLDLPPPPGKTAEEQIFGQVCEQCHVGEPSGFSVTQISRQSQLADPALLKTFLATVPPPMPRLIRLSQRQRCRHDRRVPPEGDLRMRSRRAAKLQTAADNDERRHSGVAGYLLRFNLAAVHQLSPGGKSQTGEVPENR